MKTICGGIMLNWTCPKCGRRRKIASQFEVDRGRCYSCEIETWTPEKRKAFRDLIGSFAKGESKEVIGVKIHKALEEI